MKIKFGYVIIFLISVGGLFICNSARSQNSSLDYLVLDQKDTLYGKVEYFKEDDIIPKFYRKIRLTNLKGKRRKYHRQDVISFRVDGDVYESYRLSQNNNRIRIIDPRYNIDPMGEQHFLKVVSKGALSHYLYEWIDQDNGTIFSMDLIKKQDDYYFMRATQGVFGLKKKVLAEYLDNCPSLINMISSGEFEELGQVVRYYNYKCGY